MGNTTRRLEALERQRRRPHKPPVEVWYIEDGTARGPNGQTMPADDYYKLPDDPDHVRITVAYVEKPMNM